ncbi:MAG TPA: hypothetical protein VFR97_09660 [Capillimicrobium sp.]|nr:hypothetical protein [Capillimicrobium sp.]
MHAELEPAGTDTLARRRRRVAARRLAALACDLAVAVHGAFGNRPDAAQARPRALAELRARAQHPGPSVARALGDVARLALALPPIADEEDWQLGAIAFVDELPLRELYDGCLALAAVAVREAAGA